ncbi:MAG: motility protein A, partial [Planctomycetota bacterium]
MDIGTVIGLVVAVAAIALGVVFGGNPLALVDVVSIFVVLIGTMGATIICFPISRLTKLPTVILQSVFS